MSKSDTGLRSRSNKNDHCKNINGCKYLGFWKADHKSDIGHLGVECDFTACGSLHKNTARIVILESYVSSLIASNIPSSCFFCAEFLSCSSQPLLLFDSSTPRITILWAIVRWIVLQGEVILHEMLLLYVKWLEQNPQSLYFIVLIVLQQSKTKQKPANQPWNYLQQQKHVDK